MARRRFQTGTLSKLGKRRKVWVMRWREDALLDNGTVGRIQRAETIGTVADLPTRREAEPGFLGDYGIAHPDRELAAVALDEPRADFQLPLDQVRHTGGPRPVVSNDAVAYGNRLHCGNLL